MEQYNPHKHHRRSIRLVGYDYSQAGLYFVTLVCQDRAHLFGTIKDGIMCMNEFGQIAADEWLHTQEVRNNVVLHEFVVMPNHFHLIFRGLIYHSIFRRSFAVWSFHSSTWSNCT